MGHSWWWRLVLACSLLVVVATSAEWDDNDDFAVDAATERFVEQTKHVEPKAKLAQQTTKNSTKLSSKGSSSNGKSSNAKKKRAQKKKKNKKKQQQEEELDEKTRKEKQLEETVERAEKDMTPSIIPTKTFSTGGTKKSKLNKKEKKRKKTKKTTKQSKKATKKSKKATKKGKNSISTNEAELNYAYETTHTKAQYDAQIAKAKAQKRTLLKKLAAATAAQTKIPLYKQKLRQLTRKQTRAIAGKRKIQLAKKLKAEEKDEAVLKKAMADSRARYAKMVDAKMALDAEKKSTASELERLVTDVKLNWGR